MVEISLSGSGEGPGSATAPGYSTGPFSAPPISTFSSTGPSAGIHSGSAFCGPATGPEGFCRQLLQGNRARVEVTHDDAPSVSNQVPPNFKAAQDRLFPFAERPSCNFKSGC